MSAENLHDANELLIQLGYTPIGEKEWLVLQAAGCQIVNWATVVMRAPDSKGKAYQSLRSALYGVSTMCFSALLRHEIDAPPVQLVRWLVKDGLGARNHVRALSTNSAPQPLVKAALASVRQGLGLQATTDGRLTDIAERSSHVYGASFALTVEQSWAPDGAGVLQIEIARAQSRNQNSRGAQSHRFDWNGKLAFQASESEVLQLIQVLSGTTNRVEFRHHGPDRDKGLSVEAQEANSGFYVNLRQGADSRGVLVPVFNAFKFMALAIRVIQINNQQLSTDEVLAISKQLATRFKSAA